MADDGRTVGVIDAGSAAVDRAVDAVAAAGGRAVVHEPGPFEAGPTVAVDEASLLAHVRAGGRGPVLPVSAGRGVRSVPEDALADAVASLVAGEGGTVPRRLLSITYDGTTHDALFDALLVTSEPARISEYRVTAGSPVAQFRADGVAIATPAGSDGYAGSADGPTIAPGTGVVSVVPVAPFVTDDTHWILDPADLSLSVRRDEGDVSLLVDDRDVGVVEPDRPVGIEPGERVTVRVVPASAARYPEP